MRKKRAKEEKTNGSGSGLSDLLKELWEAAVTLRGSIEAPDYKRYVLPIIFLRFLSMRYEQRQAELRALIADPSSEYHTTDPEEIEGFLSDPDEYKSASVFIVPKEATWDYLRAKAQSDDIRILLDNALELLEKTYPDKLRGLLPRIYAGSNMSRESAAGLINLFSKDIFRQGYNGEDLIGRVYEYFIGEFASTEGKRGGEYFTPLTIVRTLVAMLEPTEGIVYDPCCGSGGMFVQSDVFTKHNGRLSFYGQESKDFTYRLCRMNLFIHGLNGNIQLGSSYTNDLHAGLKADYILANPPFNDGSKSQTGWGAKGVPDKDQRLTLGTERLPLSPRNANTMWMMHFLHHLNVGGTAGFVMSTGELSSGETARREVRRTLIEQDYVDCIVQLPGQLFANTQIPSGLWFLSKNRDGHRSFRQRKGEILFIDARKMGTLIPGSRKQKQFTDEEIERIAAVYREFRFNSVPDEVAGFSKVATHDDVRSHNYTLTPGRYVGSEDLADDDEPFAESFPRLKKLLGEQFTASELMQKQIIKQLEEIVYAE